MPDIDYEAAGRSLRERFADIEKLHVLSKGPVVPDKIAQACAAMFSSKTQAYREVLLGCILARLANPETNVRQPYVEQGERAFSGRTLDEKVVNPFLHSMQIPSSKGPYLAVFRRSVQFDDATRRGLKDRLGYDALLEVLAYVEIQRERHSVLQLLDHVLYRFASLREDADIQIARLPRISLGQYESLISGLLSVPSGGRIPVILAVSMLETLSQIFRLDWIIEYAGINVTDAASGTSGDITVRRSGTVVMVLEVTERPVEASRVQTTFRSKIAASGVVDYLFMTDKRRVSPDAAEEASKYFAQGYEINFIDTSSWVFMCLATLGASGRTEYNKRLTTLFQSPELPNAVKTGWNNEVLKLAGA